MRNVHRGKILSTLTALEELLVGHDVRYAVVVHRTAAAATVASDDALHAVIRHELFRGTMKPQTMNSIASRIVCGLS